jgi:molecular chaperone GrpE (heat shock protein)
VGGQVPFDTRLHQRLSGADVQDDSVVAVRFVGYRLGETIVLKALVSRAGAAPEPADDA